MPGEHRIDLDEVFLRDLSAAVPVELQLAAMLLETLAQLSLESRLLLQQPLVDDVAAVRGAQMDPELGWEAILQLADVAGFRLVFELLLAGGEQPDAALEPLAQLGHEGLELQHPALVLVNVLADLVDDDEERLVRGSDVEHRADRIHHLADAGAGAGARPGAVVDPGARLGIAIRFQEVQGVREACAATTGCSRRRVLIYYSRESSRRATILGVGMPFLDSRS